ncbi:MAG: FAD-binding oxidoreductase [Rhodospirillales bacterium]|nr:FAD-binding oxidoreductase [Rhodospirillales bacterium]
MKSADIAVIGGGVVGLACARALQRTGRRVTLIDEHEIGRGCSFGNAGLVAVDHILPLARPDVLGGAFRMLADPLGPLHVNWASLPSLMPWFTRFAMAALPSAVDRGTKVLATLLRDAVPAWKRLTSSNGHAELFKSRGYLTLFESPRSARAAANENKLLKDHGIRFHALSPADIRERVPALTMKMCAGRYLPDSAYTTEPFDVVRNLGRQFAGDGGEVIERQRVAGFTIENDAVRGVRLRDGEILANQIVLAAGVGSKQLAQQLAIKVPLVRERGYHVMVADEIHLDTPLLFADRGFVATPMEAGLRLAGTVELGAAAPNWQRADVLRRQASVLFNRPHLTETSRWCGDRPTLPDYLPMIGPAPNHRNVVLAFGHQHLGLSLAAITGELVTDVVQGRTPRLDITALSARRFGG